MKKLFTILVLAACICPPAILGQGLGDVIIVQSDVAPENEIKLNVEKLTDKPVISDTIRKMDNIKYTITSRPEKTSYNPAGITAAKMVNEPLSKLYHCLIKAGYGNYNMPYGEIFINNLRSREAAYGFRYRHLSSSWTLKDRGYSGFSDNEIFLNGKRFFKKHTLTGDLNYLRNVVRFYGFTPPPDDKNFAKQAFNTIEAKLNLVSHFTDSTKLNHDVNLNFHNLSDSYKMNETYVGANGVVKTKIMGERFNVFGAVDFYNNKMMNDTLNNTIIKLNPYFEAGGKKWHGDIGLMAAIDKFSDSSAKFNFYPRLNLWYDIYKSIIIPYAGVTGDLSKNSFRSLTNVNPFLESQIQFRNTSNKLELYGGLRGALSSKTNYDAYASFTSVSNLPLFLIDYSDVLNNRFDVIYDDGNILKVGGQIKFTHKEKLNLIGQGNYYSYKMKNEKYAWHRPSFDIRLSGNYNIKSKIIAKAELYFIGNQWAQQTESDSTGTITNAVNLKGFADINLGVEYRYSKFLSAFVNLNNIGNMRYYRWDRYPTQRFNAMIGVTFIPF